MLTIQIFVETIQFRQQLIDQTIRDMGIVTAPLWSQCIELYKMLKLDNTEMDQTKKTSSKTIKLGRLDLAL
jgi:hypothetical protein